ncbi:Serine/threonine protein kinase [Cinnamomum micranthum f. kanehirae]|uniref:Serine/threonine protein kinase n=1 Tax=Cinnamomum micranthum f. kanehirae TaxID=337451 RepID=A0A3S3MRS8_9MAGN|nr:Serine/threonine protein kinase [Cinnamomum micranthum f. kanehirae]
MPVLHLLFLLLSLITISFLHCPITATSHSVPEYHALLALKSSITSDPSSSLQPWSSSTHHCSWPFITFDPTTLSITAIDLTNLNLTGSIPLSIRHLPNLANLSLAVNSFSDNIPPDVAHLSNLRYLNLSNNVFNGSNGSLLQTSLFCRTSRSGISTTTTSSKPSPLTSPGSPSSGISIWVGASSPAAFRRSMASSPRWITGLQVSQSHPPSHQCSPIPSCQIGHS